MNSLAGRVLYLFAIAFVLIAPVHAVDRQFHNAPDSTKELKNPFEGQPAAVQTGKLLYARNCLSCHGKTGKGTGNVPSLVDAKLGGVPSGEVFWFITKGSKPNGMPSWAFLPEQKRWQLVSYVKSLDSSSAAESTASPAPEVSTSTLKDPPPHAPFVDFRYEKPGTIRKITANDLPQPFVTKSAENGAEMVARPENASPVAPACFKVELYASGLNNRRWLRTAPNGDIFVAESDAGQVRVFRGMTSDGKPEQVGIFASGLKQPHGIAFYPPGADPKWTFIAKT